jgi:DNA repair exonuclease SbcCD ATPase subunit
MMDWMTVAALVGVLSPLVGVPLTAITLYLRSIREHQTSESAEVMQRIGRVEQSIRELSRALTEVERDYTTKEEWLRESMHARQQLERLTELQVRVQAELEDGRAMAAELARATRAIVDMAGQLMAGNVGREGQRPTDAGDTEV